jgi:hypothetical protein
MSFKFESIPDNFIKAAFILGDQTLNLVLDANILTQKQLDEINDKMIERMTVATGLHVQAAQTYSFALTLSIVIKSWDATDGEPTLDFLRTKLPFALLTELFVFCMAQIDPKAQTAEA